MLTGRAPFEGDTISDRLANILKTVPDWQRLPSDTPPSLRRVLRRALEKNENLRLRDIADARLEIDEARHEHMSPAREAAKPRRAKERIAWLVAVVAVAAIAASALWPRRASPAAPEMQFDINTPPVPDAEDPASFALSSDGQKLVFLGTVDGQPQLMLRTLDSVAARPLAGTQGAYAPFWSADGGSVGFFADSALKRIDIQGGLVRTLARASFGTGGAWNREGVILYSPNPGSSLVRISAGGAAPVEATRLETGHGGHVFPHFLPDGRHFLFSVTGSPETRGIYSGELDQVTTRKLVEADGGAVYASGHLLFVRRTTLYAQAFDVSRLELSGTPMVVIQGVGSLSFFSAMSATADGSIAIRPGLVPKVNQLVWIDRTGAELGTIGDPEDRSSPAPSPDGNQIAIARRGPAGLGSIWLMDTRRGTLSPFTTNARQDLFPAWSRDGNRIAFASFGADGVSLYQKTIGSGREDLLLPGQPTETFPLDWSPDSRVLLYQQRGMNTGWDLWSLPVGSGGKPSPAIQSEADERDALFSPDGKWIAYVANTSGRFEVYVQAFPPQGTPKQVSRNGGAQIRWRADGRELFYIALDGRLMAVPLRVANQTLDVDMAVPLFSAKVGRALGVGPGASYIVSADGQRFLLNTVVQPPIPPPIRLMLNWRPPR
jgi:Tol biopolymer transport system component